MSLDSLKRQFDAIVQAPGAACEGRGAKLRKQKEIEDAPPDHPCHQRVRWHGAGGGLFYFDLEEAACGERVRMQVTLSAAGGCRETASRIARLCYLAAEGGQTKKQALQLRDELCAKTSGARDVRDLFRSGSGPAGGASSSNDTASKARCTPTKAEEEVATPPADPAAAPELAAVCSTQPCPLEPCPMEDAPTDSAAHQKVHWMPSQRCYYFEILKEGLERVRLQTTVTAVGGCQETAAKIARLLYVLVDGGADREEGLRHRSELYERVQKHQIRQAVVRASLRTPNGKAGASPPEISPPKGKAKPRQGVELFRNLRGEVVSVSTTTCTAKTTLKPWTELEVSDVDLIPEKDLPFYEKELTLGYRRSMEERITRLEQLAQKSTLRRTAKTASKDELSLADALRDGVMEGKDFDATFLQAFLRFPPEERRHATGSEISRLERAANIADGYAFTCSERRARLKERLWEHFGASKSNGFLATWTKSKPQPLPS